jgi:hypothetical protein
MMKENQSVRPSIAMLLFMCVLTTPALLIASPCMDRLTVDIARLASRRGQLDTAKDLLAQRSVFEKLAARLENDLDAGSLFHRGIDIATVQNGLQSSVRAIVQSGGATVRLLDAKSEPGDSRRRLTIKLTAEGGSDSLEAVVMRLEAFRPRLMLRDLQLRGAEGNAGAGMTLDLEIDAYADLSPS